jgi:hypothetical protein
MRLPRRSVWLFTVAIALCVHQSSALAAEELTTCDQTLSGSAFLSADLDCSGAGPITLAGGKLNLSGFTLSGGPGEILGCGASSCTIYSDPPGGSLVGTSTDGLASSMGGAKMRFRDVTLVSLESVSTSRASFRDVAMIDCEGVNSLHTKMLDVSIAGSAATEGLFTAENKFQAKRVDVTATGDYSTRFRLTVPSFGRMKWSDSDLAGARLSGRDITLKRTTVAGSSGIGVTGNDRCKLLDAVVRDHAEIGVSCWARLVLRRSDVTQNGFDPDCGTTIACADLASTELPSIGAGSTCDTSLVLLSGIPGTSWGVCSLD